MKIKITQAGQSCRHCATPVIRCEHKPGWKQKPGRYWYRWWFKCPKCFAVYMDHSAVVMPEIEREKSAKIAQNTEQRDESARAFANALYERCNRDLE